MTTTKVANFGFIKSGGFTLPGIVTVNKKTQIQDTERIPVELPADVRDKGMLSFFFDTQKGIDDGIDVVIEVSVNHGSKQSFVFNSYIASCFQLQMSGLRPGSNEVAFTMLKGGAIDFPGLNAYLGGKGIMNFSNVCLTYHRDVVL